MVKSTLPKGTIVKVRGRLYRLHTISPLLSFRGNKNKYVYHVTPIKPKDGLFDLALASEDEFEELTEAEKILYDV